MVLSRIIGLWSYTSDMSYDDMHECL